MKKFKMVEQKLTEEEYKIARDIVRSEESAKQEYFRENYQIIKKLAPRDNRLGMTFQDILREDGFRRHWDSRIEVAMGNLNRYFASLSHLTIIVESGNYSSRSLSDLKSQKEDAISLLNQEFWNNAEFRNSFVARIRYIPMLNMLLPDVMNYSKHKESPYCGGTVLG